MDFLEEFLSFFFRFFYRDKGYGFWVPPKAIWVSLFWAFGAGYTMGWAGFGLHPIHFFGGN
jgi:hypothetical protein